MEKQNTALIFDFNSYQFSPKSGEIKFNYKVVFQNNHSLLFTEKIILPKAINVKNFQKGNLDNLLRDLHIVLGVSYYKAYCPPKINLPYRLSKKQAEFWNTVYKKGLGEFFYENRINPKTSPRFPFQSGHKSTSYKLKATSYDKCLVGIGGGKESIVALELLKQNGFNVTGFSVHTNKESELISRVAKKVGVGNIKIKRYLDPKVFDKHLYNGHVPVSAIYAFLGVLASVLYGYKYVIVGNEHSSNFGNLKYKGMKINHQWSKSLEFENIFQDYVKNFITSDVFYFSLLRPFYEIRIAKIFAEMKKYFSTFSSCNSNFRVNSRKPGIRAKARHSRGNAGRWCNQCPKCVFVFILMSAFLSKKNLLKIFGKNLYQEKDLLPLFNDVLGFGGVKPFDCVGTFQEAKVAFNLASRKYKNNFIVKILRGRSSQYFEVGEVFSAQKENAVPEKFRFLGMESVLIAGYGIEGKATEKFLKKYYPNLKIEIADQNPTRAYGRKRPISNGAKQGSDYLKKQGNYDIVIKSPGINKRFIKTNYATATNIFFSRIVGQNMIVGVTGSKGKSTTASLIYEILKAGGKSVELLGNIGKPMLERLLKPINKNTIFVLELSSYQLDDIKFSPNIAVLTSLFPEHLDFHGSAKNYYNAKKNIIEFQESGDYFVCSPKTKAVKSWLKNCKSKIILSGNKKYQSKLLGQHNQENIKLAVSAAKILRVKESTIKKAVKIFKPLPHRLEFVGKFKGIKFYDDAISTTPQSTIEAIKALKNIDPVQNKTLTQAPAISYGVDTIFLGGQDRGYDFSDLEKVIKKHKIKNAVLFPDSGKKIKKGLKGLKLLETSKMSEAVKFAYKNTAKGKICLLSCASPSYSLWKDFEEKGEEFRYFVSKLSK